MGRGIFPIAALLAASLAFLAVLLERTALPAILPVEVFGILSSVVSLALGWLWFRGRARRARTHRLGLAVAVLLAGAAGWLAWQRYGGFEAEEISFTGQDARLSGTIYWPKARMGGPAAVIVHGSGEAERSEYTYYARQLARRGVAALVFDKRGTGRSTGGLYDDGYAAYASDARAAFDLLSKRTDEVGFIGYSEGEWTVPLAAQGRKPAFVAIIGASGLTPADQVWEEMSLRLAKEGFAPEEIAQARNLYLAVSEYERTGDGQADLRDGLASAEGSDWFEAAEDFPAAGELGSPAEYEWWRSAMDTDPQKLWTTLDAPLLLLKGELDERSSASMTKRRFLEFAPDAQFRLFPGADHNLLDRQALVPRFVKGYFDLLARWIEREASSTEVR